MAISKKRNVEIDVVVDDAKARAALKGLGDSATTTGGRFSKLGDLAKVGIGAIVGSSLINFLGDAAKAAMDDELAQRQLKLALENSTKATDDQIEAAERHIDKLSRASGVADDELRPALAELARTTGDLDEAQDLLGVAMDIAAAKGIPLETVTRAIGKASLGSIGALGRLGLKTKDASGAFMDFDEVIQEAVRTMGGSMEEFADTAAGQMARAQVAFDEAKEGLGAKLLPVLVDIMDTAEETIVGLEDLGKVSPNLEGNQLLEFASAVYRGLEDIGIIEGEVFSQTAIMSRGMDDARHSIDRNRDSVEELNDAMRDQLDVEKELVDPLFRLIKANDRLDEAQRKYTDALLKGKTPSKDMERLALDLAEAQLEVNSAATTYAIDGGPTSVEALKKLLRQAGLSEDGIESLIREIDRLNRTPVNIPDRRHYGSGSDRDNRSEYHTGGVVPGTPGSEVNATLLAGETVIPRGGAAGGVNVYVTAGTVVGANGMQELANMIQAELVRSGRRNGTTGIR